MAYNETRNAVVQVGKEAVASGTEAAAFSTVEINGSDAATVISPDLAFVEATILRPDFDQRPGTPGRAKSMINIPSYATVPPAKATPAPTPVNGILLYGAGLAETTVAGATTSAWTPTAAAGDQSISVRNFTDGIKTTSLGVRGGFSMDMSAGNYPTFTFTGEGNYANPETVAVPSVSYPDEVLHQVETAGMTIGGTSGLVIRSFNFDWSVTQTDRLDINSANGYKGTGVTAKAGRVSAVVEFQETVTWSPEALLLAGSTHVVSLEIGDLNAGSTLGSSIKFNAPAAQIQSVSRSADSGAMVASIDFLCTGGTPFTLTFSSGDIA